MKKLVSWVEIPAVDFERAVKFYTTVLGIELQVVDCEGNKLGLYGDNPLKLQNSL